MFGDLHLTTTVRYAVVMVPYRVVTVFAATDSYQRMVIGRIVRERNTPVAFHTGPIPMSTLTGSKASAIAVSGTILLHGARMARHRRATIVL